MPQKLWTAISDALNIFLSAAPSLSKIDPDMTMSYADIIASFLAAGQEVMDTRLSTQYKPLPGSASGNVADPASGSVLAPQYPNKSTHESRLDSKGAKSHRGTEVKHHPHHAKHEVAGL